MIHAQGLGNSYIRHQLPKLQTGWFTLSHNGPQGTKELEDIEFEFEKDHKESIGKHCSP
jgi:hypothetical protein